MLNKTGQNVSSTVVNAPGGRSSSPNGCYRVLIVDDDRDISELLDAGLTLDGYKTETAEDGEQAIRRLETEAYDLVLVDLLMPVVGGLRLISWLRDNQKSSIRIIVSTGHDDESTIESARKAGADEVLIKPFELADLHATIQRLLGQSAAAEKKGKE